ncbi:MAG: DUF1800 domain-containing protein [Actinomycetota bacterium]
MNHALDTELLDDDMAGPVEDAPLEGDEPRTVMTRRGVLGVLAAGAVVAACSEPSELATTPSVGEPLSTASPSTTAQAASEVVPVNINTEPVFDTSPELGEITLPSKQADPGQLDAPSDGGGDSADSSASPVADEPAGSNNTSSGGGTSQPSAPSTADAAPAPPKMSEDTAAAMADTTTTTAAPATTTSAAPASTSTSTTAAAAAADKAPALPKAAADTTTSTTSAAPRLPQTSTTTTTVATTAPAAAAETTTTARQTTTTTAAPETTTTTAAPETTTTAAPETTTTQRPAPASATLTAETAVAKLTFGPTPGQIAAVARSGPKAFIDDQLRRTQPDGSIENLVREIKPIHMSPKELNDNRIRNWWMANYTGHIALFRASRSANQLFEMMSQLWMDHFNVFLVDEDQYFIPDYQENVIRRHAMGTFSDLLKGTAHAPAMLRYLNNDVSNASTPDGINENYGRELLELHSLGIDRNNRQIYNQQDVENVSMVMGGWSAERDRNKANYGTFVYRPEYEYRGPDLNILNGAWSTAGLSGKARGDSLLEFLAAHPTTAHHIAYKICRRFVSDVPSDALINSTAQVYLANGTAIVPMLRHVFASAEFAASGGLKARRPLEFQAALLRATTTHFSNIGEHITFRRLGGYYLQPAGHEPWMWGTPDGYPDYSSHWIVADALIKRWNHAIQVAEGRVGETTTDIQPLLRAAGGQTAGELVQGLAAQLGLGTLSDDVVTANLEAIRVTPDQPLSELNLEDRRFGTLVGLLIAHPLFQIR